MISPANEEFIEISEWLDILAQDDWATTIACLCAQIEETEVYRSLEQLRHIQCLLFSRLYFSKFKQNGHKFHGIMI